MQEVLVRMLALRAALRAIGMIFNHSFGCRRAPRWDDRDDRLKACDMHAAMLGEFDDDDLRSMLKCMASFPCEPRAIDVVELVEAR